MSDTRPICMITGLGEGTGGYTAKKFAKEGYRIAMLARSEERLDRFEKEEVKTTDSRTVIASVKISLVRMPTR